MNISDNKLVLDEVEGKAVPVGPGTFVLSQPQMPEQQIVIHAVGYRKVAGAIASMQEKPKPGLNKRSVHLILGEDGKEFAQMVPFNKVANHTFTENTKSIGIELIYRGPTAEPKSDDGEKVTVTKEEFQASPHILASGLNDSGFKRWPLFPKAQLDALLEICKTIDLDRQIVDAVGCEQLQPSPQPGPAFPTVQFREQLLGVTDRSILLQKLGEAVQLLGRPGEDVTVLSSAVVPAGTSITIINERGKWYLISVVGEIDGNKWLMGWVRKSAVIVDTQFTPVVRDDHFLATTQGRRFEHILPHPHGYDANKNHQFNPKYIIMHFTTGGRIESTISHFKNPSAGVATHLLVGRDGRVVQFLPFNVPANHTGFSWWEGERSLNRFSIGIEMDNVGPVSFINGQWKRKGVVFTEDQIEKAVHWKESHERGWEKFPPAQVAVVKKIVRALLEKYKDSVLEILGHDEVNIANRLDPGPAFHLDDFRTELLGPGRPRMKVFALNQAAPMFMNVEGGLPNLERTEPDGTLPSGSTLIVTNRVHGSLVLVKVIAGAFKGRSGWIETLAIEPAKQKFGMKKKQAEDKAERRKTRVNQPFFPRGKNPPTPKIKAGTFDAGTEVRVQEFRGEWALVVLTKMVPGSRSIEGWVQSKFLTAKE